MSIIEHIRLLTGAVFLLGGLVLFALELYGIYHMKYVLNRMHAAAIGDTLGISFCLIGLMIFSGWNWTTLKMALVVLFLWWSSPVSSHLISRLEVETNPELSKHLKKGTLEEITESKEEQS